MDQQERQHDPTEARLNRARETGDFAKSPLLSSAIFIGLAVGLFLICGPQLVEGLRETLRQQFAFDSPTLIAQPASISSMTNATVHLTKLIAPMLIGLFIIAFISQGWQTAFKLFPNKVGFDFSKVNPFTNAAQIFSSQKLVSSSVRLLRLVVMISVVMGAIYLNQASFIESSFTIGGYSLELAAKIAARVLGGVAIVMVAFAIVDYVYQVWSYRKRMMLSNQELQDELRALEGNPENRNRRRSMQAEFAEIRLALASVNAATALVCGSHTTCSIKQTEHGIVLLGIGTGQTAQRMKTIGVEKEVTIIEQQQTANRIAALDLKRNQIVPDSVLDLKTL